MSSQFLKPSHIDSTQVLIAKQSVDLIQHFGRQFRLELVIFKGTEVLAKSYVELQALFCLLFDALLHQVPFH